MGNFFKNKLLDVLILFFAVFIGLKISNLATEVHPITIILGYVLTYFTTFTLLEIEKVYWKHAGLEECIQLVKASIITQIILVIIYIPIAFLGFLYLPLSFFTITFFLSLTGIILSRFRESIYDSLTKKERKKRLNTIIIGAGNAGKLIIQELKRTNSNYYPVAVVDDNPKKKNLKLLGIPIVGTSGDINNIIAKYDIKVVIIAIPSATKEEISNLLTICNKTTARVMTLPSIGNLIRDNFLINQLEDVNISDLLRRKQITIDSTSISEYMKNKTVLITGAGGSIGSELSRQISRAKPKQLILLGHGENSIFTIQNELIKDYPDCPPICMIADILDKSRIEFIINQYKPNYIFHAAAHKHVPLMEDNPIEAIKNNVMGTYYLANAANKPYVEKFILISTDKAVNPTSVMGATKNVAEQIIYQFNEKSSTSYSIVRFGNVLGSRGSVIHSFFQQIKKGGPLTVTHPEMRRFFMTIPEAVHLVLHAGALSKGGEIFVLNMGEQIKIANLAEDLIRLSGYEPGKDILIEYTGIRPGEKLYEELYTKEEQLLATQHDKISVSKSHSVSIDADILIGELEQNLEHFNHMNNEKIKDFLQSIVPTYTP